VREAQDFLLETAQAIARAQYGLFEDAAAAARTVLNTKEPRTPEAALTGAKATAERAFAVARQSMELGSAAQRRVAELAGKRVVANLEDFKTLLAA
jgi:hypothetical protein